MGNGGGGKLLVGCGEGETFAEDCMWVGTFLEEVPLICSPDEAEGSEEVLLLCAFDEVCDRHWSSELSMEKEVI